MSLAPVTKSPATKAPAVTASPGVSTASPTSSILLNAAPTNLTTVAPVTSAPTPRLAVLPGVKETTSLAVHNIALPLLLDGTTTTADHHVVLLDVILLVAATFTFLV
jgi:hypothetical protein